MRTLLVGAGFLGSYFLSSYLKNKLNSIVVADTRPLSDLTEHPILEGEFKNIQQDQFKYYNLSAGDPWTLVDEFEKGIDNIVYTAAIANVGFAIRNPTLTMQTNCNQLLTFLEFLRRVDFTGHFLIMSSESVLGHQPEERLHSDTVEKLDKDGNPTGITTTIPRGFREDECIPRPSNVYGATKLMQENLSLCYHSMYGIRTTVLRSSTMIGQFMRMDQAIPSWINEVMTNGTLTRDGDGSQSRDFIHVRNVANSIIRALRVEDNRIDGEILHVGSGREQQFDAAAKQIVKMYDFQTARIVSKPWRPGEKGLRVVLDCSKAIKLIGHDPDYDWSQALADIFIWLANYKLYWPVEEVEKLAVSFARMPPSQTKLHQKFVAEHGRRPESYQELIGKGIGPATGTWKGKQWQGHGAQPPPPENRFETDMRVAGFGAEDDLQKQAEMDTLRKYGFDPEKLLTKPPTMNEEKEEIMSVSKEKEVDVESLVPPKLTDEPLEVAEESIITDKDKGPEKPPVRKKGKSK